jgi:excisionase family DNA binding protein
MSISTHAAPKKRTRLPVPPKDALALRIPGACALIGIGRSTLYLLIDSGKLKTVHISGRHLVPRAELERLATEGSNSGELSEPCLPHMK